MMPAPSECVAPTLSPAESSVLHTLLYFDIFRHALTADEVHRNGHWLPCSPTETAAALESLRRRGVAAEQDGAWFLAGKDHLVPLRNERRLRAQRFTRKAKIFSSLIASFPFVRGVSISGSLSKGTMDPDGDIDYFIITEPRRLWIARTLLVLFKKIFLLNSKKYFCVNYFIDTSALTIPDCNLFVATEITYIRPMHNGPLHDAFLEANRWVKQFFPNHSRESGPVAPPANGWIKRGIERLMGGRFGEWLDERLLRLTLRRWKKKFAHLENVRFDVDFRSRRHVSKHHPQGFQHKVSRELERKRQELNERHGIELPALPWEWSDHDTLTVIR